jgi:hypothetical protein
MARAKVVSVQPIHQLDTRRKPLPHEPAGGGCYFAVCGARVSGRLVTKFGWQVTCEDCRGRGRKRPEGFAPRPAPATPFLEDA